MARAVEIYLNLPTAGPERAHKINKTGGEEEGEINKTAERRTSTNWFFIYIYNTPAHRNVGTEI